MKIISRERIEKKWDYFFELTDVKRKELQESLFEKQPEMAAFAYGFSAEEAFAKKNGEIYQYSSDEVAFGTDILTFILFIMLPQDKAIPVITSKKIGVYQDKALEVVEKVSDEGSLSAEQKDALLLNQPQKELWYFVLNEMLCAHEDHEIEDDFWDVFMVEALTMIGCLDGEVA